MIHRKRSIIEVCTLTTPNSSYSFGLVSIYGALLWVDICMINWYKDFYDAINQKSSDEFLIQIAYFIAFTTLQAVCFGLIANTSELMEANSKIKIVEWKTTGEEGNFIYTEKIEQRLIDDALLVAEKITGLIPSLIFNILKIITLMIMLGSYTQEIELNGINIAAGAILLGIFLILMCTQIYISSMAKKVISRTEDLKRQNELIFRKKIKSIESTPQLKAIAARYMRHIFQVRGVAAKNIGIITSSLSLTNSLSYVIPFLILFHLFGQSALSLGELMKVAALYGALGNAVQFIFNSYADFFRLFSALKRIEND